MEKKNSGGGRGRKTLRKVLAALFLLPILLLLFIYLFLNSPYSPALIAGAAERAIGREVRITSLTAGPREGLTLRGISIGRGPEELGRIKLLRIRLHPKGLATGRVLSLSAINPLLFYSGLTSAAPETGTKAPGESEVQGYGKNGAAGIEPPSIPWFFKEISLSGLVLRQSPGPLTKDDPGLIGPLDLTFSVRPGNMAALRVKTYIPLLKTSASINVKLGTRKLSLLHGDLDLGVIELKDLGTSGVSIIRHGQGSIKAGIEVSEDKGAIRAAFTGKFRDIFLQNFFIARPASGTLRTVLTLNSDLSRVDLKARLFIKEQGGGKGERSIGVVKASYDIKESIVRITEAVLTLPSPTAGSIHLRGVLHGASGPNPRADIKIRAEKLPLSLFNETILRPLSIKVIDKDNSKGVSGRASLRGTPEEGLGWETELTLADNLSYGPYVLRLSKDPLRISSRGTYSLKNETLRIQSLRASAGAIRTIIVDGSIRGLTKEEPEMDLRLHGQDLKIGAISKTLSIPGISDVKAEGSLGFDITVRGRTAWPAISGRVLMKGINLDGYGLTLKKAGMDLGFNYGRDGLRLKKIRAAADSLVFTTKDGPRPKLQKVSLLIPALTYEKENIRVENLKIKIKKALLPGADNTPLFEEDNITLKGSLRGDLVKNRFIGEKLTFSAGTSGGITGLISDMLLDLKDPVRADAAVDIQNLPIEKIMDYLPGFSATEAGLDLSGLMDMGLKLKTLDWSEVTGRVRLSLKDGAFSANEGNVAAEGVRLLVQGDFNADLPHQKAGFSIEAEASGFELLANSFYGSFTDTPLKMEVQGEYDGGKDSLIFPAIKVELNPVGSLKMGVAVSSLSAAPRLEAHPVTVDISNKEFYDLFIRQTFMESMPILEGLDLQGRTVLSMRVEGTAEDFSIKGLLELREAGLREKAEEREGSKLLVRGVDLTLPIELSYPEAKKSKIKDFGALSIEEVMLGPLKLSDFKAAPAIAGNFLEFARALEIPLFGGTVTLDNVVFADLLSPRRALSLQMSVRDIDLGEAGLALGLPPFEGTLSGEIPGIRLAGNHLTTEGEMRLSLFGGLVKIKDMSVENVFSPVAALKSSIDISDLDLGALTKTFEFGKITGVLQGRIKDLVIVQGQPESFFVDISTVKRRGVSQRISTKALENVSILGTGAAASILNRGIYSLFNEYRYERMGFQGQLKNDELLLLGIETEGDKGYIIKGALIPPRVDVVSYTARISFKEMMKRLEGVNFSSAETR